MQLRKILIPILCILFAASILRLWNLDRPDINPDEDHYIQDAVRFSRKDPFISIRYHTFKHPEPSIGHPFLAQITGAGIFKILGYSNFTARLPQALAGIFTVAALFLFSRSLSGRVAVISASILAIFPFAVRYNRDAHLDSIFAFLVALTALFIWRYNFNRNFIWLIAAGIAVGLAISTKLDGIITLFLSFALLSLSYISSGFAGIKNFKELIKAASLILIVSSIIAFLLNDPASYLGAIFKPSDPNFKLISAEFWISSAKSYKFWGQVGFYLLSPPVLFIWLASVVYLLIRHDYTSRFLLVWQITLLSLFVFHRPGLSGQYGLLPVTPPIVISMSYFLHQIFKKKSLFIVTVLIIMVLPFTRLYGLYLKSLPYYKGDSIWTRTIGDSFYLDTIKNVNDLAPRNGKVFLLPQSNYPLFSLRSDLSWTYSDIEDSDVFVVSSPELIESVETKIVLIGETSRYQDDENLIRYIFAKKTSQKNDI